MSPEDLQPFPSLPALEDVDRRVRALYASLADDPDRADDLEPELARLRDERRLLAIQAGLELLAWSRTRAANTPARADAEEPTPRPPPATPQAVMAFIERLQTDGLHKLTAPPSEHPASILGRLVRQVGAPRDSSSLLGATEELDALDDVSADPEERGWHLLARDTQRLWVSALVARARALKASSVLSDAQRDRLRIVLKRFPVWSAQHRPGYVHGLALDHTPKGGSWTEDARELWQALADDAVDDGTFAGAPRRELTPRPPASSGGQALTTTPEELLPVDWYAWPAVRGKRAVLVGGTPREDARVRLERAFALVELSWLEPANPRRVDAVVRRIAGGTIDFVLLIQNLIDHAAADSLVRTCKAGAVPFALTQGYGVGAVRSALEKLAAIDTQPSNQPAV